MALASRADRPPERRRLIVSDDIITFLGAIKGCRICADKPSGRALPHEPRPIFVHSPSARILIASQAPGTKAHSSGIPFADASGNRLRDWLGVTPAQFYDPANFAIAPIGFCFPGQDAQGGDLPPRRECAPAWRGRLMASMPQIDLVLTIGLYAQAWHLGGLRSGALTDTVMNWRTLFNATPLPRVLPLPHPSWRNSGWLKRNPWFETDLLPFLKTEIRDRLYSSSGNNDPE